MEFSQIHESPILLFAWITTLGFLISLTEASVKIRFENYNNIKSRQKMIRNLYPKNLA